MSTTTRTSGIHAATGKALSESAHIAQSIGCILATPIGSRVMREDFGSLIPDMIDYPQTPALALQLSAAAFMAIKKWEPRIKVTAITLNALSMSGRRELTMQGQRVDTGDAWALNVPLGGAA